MPPAEMLFDIFHSFIYLLNVVALKFIKHYIPKYSEEKEDKAADSIPANQLIHKVSIFLTNKLYLPPLENLLRLWFAQSRLNTKGCFMESSFLTATSWILPILFAVTFHEAAHGFIAERFGDDTARTQGRVTLNPFNHIDFFGTILLPGFLLFAHSPILLGYAKPVPVDFNRLQPLRYGMLSVAIAGPATNLLLAIASALLLHLGADVNYEDMPWWQMSFYNSLFLNCMLAILNMLPILPLDGGRVLMALLPEKIADKFAMIEPYGFLILIGLLLIPISLKSDVVTDAFAITTHSLMSIILTLTGH